MRFELEGIQYELKGLKYGPSQVIISHRMEKLLKKRSKGVVVKLYSMEVNQEDEILHRNQDAPWKNTIRSSKKFLRVYIQLEIMNIK
jgi:hypothetical protein